MMNLSNYENNNNNITTECPLKPTYNKETMIGTGNYIKMANAGICTPICPLKTTYRSRDPISYTSNDCPQYQYFNNNLTKMETFNINKLCCCTLWCPTNYAVDYSSPGILIGLLLVLIRVLLGEADLFYRFQKNRATLFYLLTL